MSTIPVEKVENLSEEIDTPEGIVNFLQKRNGLYSKDYTSKYSVTELVGCQRKSFYKQLVVQEIITNCCPHSFKSCIRK